jgi:hypothetical protein
MPIPIQATPCPNVMVPGCANPVITVTKNSTVVVEEQQDLVVVTTNIVNVSTVTKTLGDTATWDGCGGPFCAGKSFCSAGAPPSIVPISFAIVMPILFCIFY